MAKAKKILVTTATREVMVFRSPAARWATGFCPACGIEVTFVDLDSAVELSGCGAFNIFEKISGGSIHAEEAAAGHLYICSTCLNGPGPVSNEGQ